MADALFPKEIIDVLNTSFMGFKVWHLLIVALLVPSPVAFLVLFLLIPGFKEKATEVIKNGFSGVSTGTDSGTGEDSQVPAASKSQDSTAPGGSYRGEGKGPFREQFFQEAAAGFRSAEGFLEAR